MCTSPGQVAGRGGCANALGPKVSVVRWQGQLALTAYDGPVPVARCQKAQHLIPSSVYTGVSDLRGIPGTKSTHDLLVHIMG